MINFELGNEKRRKYRREVQGCAIKVNGYKLLTLVDKLSILDVFGGAG